MVVTDTRPATVPQVALNNGSKRVVFQGMQHIGSEHFYKAVIYDVDAIELKAEYERLMRVDPAFVKAHANDFQPKPATNDNAFMLKAVEWLKNGSQAQKTLGGVACRGLFTLSQPGQDSPPGPMQPVILDFRNRALAGQIMQSKDDKIFITYGAAHLPGLVAELRKLDSKWAVGSDKWMRTIEAPEHIEGKLRGLGK